MNIKVLRVNKTNMFDVFFGNGWDTQARIAVSKTGYIKYINGHNIRGHERKILEEVKSYEERALKLKLQIKAELEARAA